MSLNNNNIIIGKNKKDNWKIIDEASPNDIWFHVDNFPSSHVILKNENNDLLKNIPKQIIKRCACLCKSHSSVPSMKNCEIVYTQISNVKKTNIVGQVVTQNTKSKRF